MTSYRQSFLQCFPPGRNRAVIDDDIGGEPRDLPNAFAEQCEFEQGHTLIRGGQEVDIAVESVVAASDRAEYAKIPQTQTFALFANRLERELESDRWSIVSRLQHSFKHVGRNISLSRLHLSEAGLAQTSTTSQLGLRDAQVESGFTDQRAGVVRIETPHADKYSAMQ